jgi:cupin 2 domain-containing protein
MSNILDKSETPDSGERFDELLGCKNVRIERIVSSETPERKEYIQDHDEWVMVLKGSAVIVVDGTEEKLGEGDYLFIPQKTPHTVTRTDQGTVWLAVHIE